MISLQCSELLRIITIVIGVFGIIVALYIPQKIHVNQIFANLLREYRSNLMANAIKRIRDFYENDCMRKTDYQFIINKYVEIYENEVNNSPPETWKNSLHFQRRKVSQFYQQLSNLCSHSLCSVRISENKLKKYFSKSDLDIIQILYIIDSNQSDKIYYPKIPKIDIKFSIKEEHKSMKYMYHLYNKSLNWNDNVIKTGNPLISFIAFISLLTSTKLFSKIIGNVDYENELSKNEQLQKASEDIKRRTKEEKKDQAIKTGIVLRRKFLKSFIWLLSATLIACVVTNQFDIERFLITSSKALFPFISIFLFAFGTLGRLGWEGQTLDGNTVYEKLDNRILWITYFIGTIFGVLSIL